MIVLSLQLLHMCINPPFCDLLAIRKGTIHGSMNDNGQLSFYKINVVVRYILLLLVLVYRHQYRTDTPTVHYYNVMYCILHTH